MARKATRKTSSKSRGKSEKRSGTAVARRSNSGGGSRSQENMG